MTGWWTIGVLVAYAVLLTAWSRLFARKSDNPTFFIGERRSNWLLVAFGMIGASVSGVSFISVPGWVEQTHMTYLQMCLGFVPGYLIVAYVLLPLYWRIGQPSIYAFLRGRFGQMSHRTGSLFFVASKLVGASARLYVVVLVLHEMVFRPLGCSFILTAVTTLLLIWLYTHRSGIRALVYTDVLQTAFMLAAIGALLYAAAHTLGLDARGLWRVATQHEMSEVFRWSGMQSFWRQFFSGIFIVIVMTGLDQDMMQKNLSCRSLRAAQKDMCTYGLGFLPVNFVLLLLGILLYMVCSQQGLNPPEPSDRLLPFLVGGGHLGAWVIVPFALGIMASAFSSADSALTALTTTTCIDLLSMPTRQWDEWKQIRIRRIVHAGVVLMCLLCTIVFRAVNSGNAIHAIYVLASYTYGPLLGLFAFGLFTRRSVRDWLVPAVCIMAPVACGLLDHYSPVWWNYRFGYELLMLNGAITFMGLWMLSLGQGRTDILSQSDRNNR